MALLIKTKQKQVNKDGRQIYIVGWVIVDEYKADPVTLLTTRKSGKLKKRELPAKQKTKIAIKSTFSATQP